MQGSDLARISNSSITRRDLAAATRRPLASCPKTEASAQRLGLSSTFFLERDWPLEKAAKNTPILDIAEPFSAQLDGKMNVATSDAFAARDNSCAQFRDTFCFTVARRDSIAA